MSDESAEVGSRSERSPRRTVPAGALVLAVMVAAALGILAVVALAIDDDDASPGGGSGELDDVRLAAGRFAERFLTFEDDALDTWRDEVEAMSTAGFAEEVDEVQEGLRRLISEAELDAQAEVTGIFTGEVERGAVDVIVIYDRQLTSASGARDETDRYMQLALLRVDGQWLVDNVIDIATAGAAGTSPASPAPDTDDSTTSTAPQEPATDAPG